jgi:serine/threonine protein kinase
VSDSGRFKNYRLTRRVTAGGMGEIFLAKQIHIGGIERPVIIKTLLSDTAEDEVMIRSFLDEARIAASLNHPNIVSLIEVGEFDGTIFIAMEYIPGHQMACFYKHFVEKAQPMPELVAARLIHDAAKGLAHAHQACGSNDEPLNLVHRDVSPQNIMVRKDGVTKILDFGIAAASNRAVKTQTGIVRCKIGYVAPEHVLSRKIDCRTDLFSLGVVLWELLTRQRLRQKGSTTIDTLLAAAEDEVPRVSTVWPGVTPELDEIVAKMTALAPEDRYASCDVVAKKLHEFIVRDARDDEAELLEVISELSCHDEGELLDSTPTDLELPKSSPSAPNPTESLTAVKKTSEKKRAPLRSSKTLRGITGLVFALGAASLALSFLDVVPDSLWSSAAPSMPTAPTTPSNLTPPPAAPITTALILSSTPPNAEVFLDGIMIGETPLKKENLKPGRSYELKLRHAGYALVQKTFTANKTSPTTLNFEMQEPKKLVRRPNVAIHSAPKVMLESQSVAKALAPGYLSISTNPWTTVRIDGHSDPRIAPFSNLLLPAGDHKIHFENRVANIKSTRVVTVNPGQPTVLKINFENNAKEKPAPPAPIP